MAHKNVIFGGGEFDLYINPDIELLDVKLEQGFNLSANSDDTGDDQISSLEEEDEEYDF